MLLLQTITFSKNRYNELTIVYRSQMTKQRCETKISLSTNLKDRVSLNYLYCIAEPRQEDMLAFEVAQERVEVRLKEILKKTNVIIVGKTNSRKIAEIAYQFVQSQKNDGRQRIGDMNNIAQIKNKENDIDSLNSHRKTIYIKVCPQRPSKVTLQGK